MNARVAHLLKQARFPQYPTGIDDLYYYGELALTGKDLEYFVKQNLSKPNVSDFAKGPHLEEIMTELQRLYPSLPPKLAYDSGHWIGTANGETVVGYGDLDDPQLVMAAVYIQAKTKKQ